MFSFDNTYARLPERFYARVAPAHAPTPRVLRVNRALADFLGVDADRLATDEGAAILAGNVVPDGAEPLALAYAGHQFGTFVRQLGDGRAILLGEVMGKDGKRYDVQLKGSGRTPFSRRGDGRAALGPVLREYVVSEAMAALGVPTTRALAAVATGERVYRNTALPGAIVVRVASSHLRVGTFQYFAARGDLDALRALVAYALDRHFGAAKSDENAALALLDHVVAGQAELVARWLGLGFVHGVMNTDNTSIACETLDYGPCAFLDAYAPDRTFSSIDEFGRYAFSNQPRVALWNLSRLADALLPLVADDEAEAVRRATERLERFPALFEAAHARVLGAKLGLSGVEPDDGALGNDLLGRLATSEVDFTLFFRKLCASAADTSADGDIAALFDEPGAFHSWAESWRKRTAHDERTPAARAAAMRRANPAFIPRNHRVEEAIEAAVAHDDLAPFEALSAALETPYDDQPAFAHLAVPPGAEQYAYKTFCGT